MKTYRILFLLVASAVLFGVPAALRAADSPKPANSKPTDAKLTANLPLLNKQLSQDAAASYQTDNYKLRPTDGITINVVDDASATHDYHIGIDGTVQLIYLDAAPPIKLAGLTIADAKKAVIKAYVDNKIYNAPSIIIDVKDYSTRRISVLGQVMKPGPVYIPAQKDMTLVAAIAEAGGPTEKAAATVTINRIQADGTPKTLENVDLYGAMKDARKDIPLQEGDSIFLGESAFANVYQH